MILIAALIVVAALALLSLGAIAFRIGQIQERNAMLQRELDAKRAVIDKREERREKVFALIRENTRVTPRRKS